jgi:hypothetical protein
VASISVLRQVEVESDKIGTSSDELSNKRIIRVIGNGRWASLGSRPEWLTFLILVIFREDMEQVLDAVVVELLEMISSKFNALVEISRFLQVDELLDFLDSRSLSRDSCVLLELTKED